MIKKPYKKPKKKPIRKRNKQLVLRLTEEEIELFRVKCKKSKKSQADFFLLALEKTNIVVIEDITPLLQELKREGKNLNQVQKRINLGTPIHGEIEKAINDCRASYLKVLEVMNNAVANRFRLQEQTE